MADVIVLDHVSKRFIIHHQRSRSFQQVLINSLRRNGGRQEFWALRDVSLAVGQGETLGLIGENGSGKSTVLKLIARILEPTSGKLTVSGRVAALLEIGAGFHPDLTGRENIFLNGSVLGFSRRYLQSRYDDIVEFAELGDFLDTPIKHYSSGMHMRLGFAVAVNLDPDVLLLDEVLAVGDEHFQHKCFEKMAHLQSEGRTMVLVSHDLGAVSRMCQKALWLDDGRIRACGPSAEVVDAYLADTAWREQRQRWLESHRRAEGTRSSSLGAIPSTASASPAVTGDVALTDLRFLDGQGQETSSFQTGQRFVIRLCYQARKLVEDPVFGIAIHTPTGVEISGPNTARGGYDIDCVEGEGEVDFVGDSLPLLPGTYVVSAAVHNRSQTCMYDYRERMKFFTVVPRVGEAPGMFDLAARWEHRSREKLAGGVSS